MNVRTATSSTAKAPPFRDTLERSTQRQHTASSQKRNQETPVRSLLPIGKPRIGTPIKRRAPISCTTGFEECYNVLFGYSNNYQSDPLYIHILKMERKLEDEARDYNKVIAEYLSNVALSVDETYYRKVLMLFLLYREILKKNWISKSSESESSDKELLNMIPERGNEVLVRYLKLGLKELDLVEAAAIIIDFCTWLLYKDYTTMQLQVKSTKI
eukprot:TRINITY_DN7353_c0_g2_i1.p1 TRINITY_DN7353_c0_g2~~TRINITY_DN7353_c0_g2_i1.p1  ORF type:complete len:214 (-),score=33.72 TRINITY_DN7353_c0_g2_i1:113-754(-)